MTSPTLDLKRLAELEAKATPGPWSLTNYSECATSVFINAPMAAWIMSSPIGYSEWRPQERNENTQPRHDAALIVEARNALPALLAEITALRAGLEEIAEIDDVDFRPAKIAREVLSSGQTSKRGIVATLKELLSAMDVNDRSDDYRIDISVADLRATVDLIAALREALEPFARMADEPYKAIGLSGRKDFVACSVRTDDLIRVHAALSRLKQMTGEE